MKIFRTDLAIERDRFPEKREQLTFFGINAQKIEHESKKYLSLDIDFTTEFFEPEFPAKAAAEALRMVLPSEGSVLVAALGNHAVSPDALGVAVAERLTPSRHIAAKMGSLGLRELSIISPSVLGKTGIESCEIVKKICELVRPRVVIAIDALAAGDIKRLGKTLQISDSGIAPGSGVQGTRQELSETTLGCRVVSIGVPTVIDACNISDELPEESCPFVVTTAAADLMIDNAANVISEAITSLLFPA